mmetsp:Transcript_22516/g.30834  ORF Transcript_22516/g.30834 Transcript_22516/m.30834 type:complete len:697 (-) Transcript_22516:1824-3914(-)
MLFKRFSKVITTGSSRTKAAVKAVVSESLFPHTLQQLDAYLKKYADKPELARESVFELINKRTTHTWVEELKVFKLMRHTSHVIGILLRVLKLKKLHRVVFTVGRQADSIAKLSSALDPSTRLGCSGHEAKAAWLLRVQVIELMCNYLASTVLIQKVYRKYRLASKWRVLLKRRVLAVSVIQRSSRRTLACMLARRLRAQRESEWEQLWNPAKSMLYYYNYVTKKSQYPEPDGPFRPLVRDRCSAALIQAWPEVDNHRGVHALLPGMARAVVTGTLCAVCGVRRCLRECLQCANDKASGDDESRFYDVTTQAYVVPYCFACFVKEHQHRQEHEFIVMNGESGSGEYEGGGLRCCLCEEPSCRKCMGSLDEQQVDEICRQLKKTKLLQWRSVLADNQVGGERKLTLLLDEILVSQQPEGVDSGEFDGSLTPAATTATSAQLQSVRAMLEQIRAECDECYCVSCYEQVHAGGRRAEHKWKGHQPFCAVCVVCKNSAAETECLDCQAVYCESCSKVFHAMGRKKRHKQQPVVEAVSEGQSICGYCKRRAADTPCGREGCEVCGCDSCMAFVHTAAKCAQEIIEAEAAAVMAATRSGKMFSSKNKKRSTAMVVASKPSSVCAVCEEVADHLCVQCGDLYCSKPSDCFGKMHSRGNRATHTLQPLANEEQTKAASVLKLPGIAGSGGGLVVSPQKLKQKRM